MRRQVWLAVLTLACIFVAVKLAEAREPSWIIIAVGGIDEPRAEEAAAFLREKGFDARVHRASSSEAMGFEVLVGCYSSRYDQGLYSDLARLHAMQYSGRRVFAGAYGAFCDRTRARQAQLY